jgi:glutamine synthetase
MCGIAGEIRLDGGAPDVAAVAGLVYELPEEEQGDPIPLTLDAALDALEADAALREAMGTSLVGTFLTIKRFELERYHRHVSEWDIAEYAHRIIHIKDGVIERDERKR